MEDGQKLPPAGRTLPGAFMLVAPRRLDFRAFRRGINLASVNPMDSAQLLGLQAQRVLQRRMEIAAHNLANMTTTGFKADMLIVDDVASNPARNAEAPHDIRFARDITVGRNMRAGAVEVTNEPLDVAIEGDGFLMVMGPSGVAYTRNGALSLGADGALVTAEGFPVLDSGGAPIVLDPEAGPPTITPDGAITQNGAEAGRIGVVAFARPGALEKIGASLWDGAGQAQTQFEGRVIQGALESSNVEPISELTQIIAISRAYESAAKLVQNADQTRQRALERLGR
ncbi:MAG: flagellar basal-body rod protein FlgF [Alphaproteobacteria bacterium]|nr:flagellar basal-body rod protein FlgF [Alphaproteobacteria bacterium]